MGKIKPSEDIEIEGELLNCVSYAEYYLRIPLFTSFGIFNRGEKGLAGLSVKVTGSTPLILPSEEYPEEIPAGTGVEACPKNILNPRYLAELESPEECTVTVEVRSAARTLCSLTAHVTALPINYWAGLSGNPEMLAAFVRPKLPDCAKILAEAGLQLKTWGYSSEFSGYAGNDKNAVRSAAASLFSAIRHLDIEREEDGDLSAAGCAGDIENIVSARRATPLSLALFAASCIEAVKLNPVILIGKKGVAVGVWLSESCFSAPVQDDMQLVDKYLSDGVNNLAAFDAQDLFAHKNASVATSGGHVSDALSKGVFEACVDIKRCRAGGILPLPLKVKTQSGYELLGAGQFSYDEKPEELIDASRYNYDKSLSREMVWQRRLLDLSLKNNLLNFRYSRDAVHVLSGDLGDFCDKLFKRDKFTVLPNAGTLPEEGHFGAAKKVGAGGAGELVLLEAAGGKLRAAGSPEYISESLQNLVRKARSAQEEAGANTLYLAAGFLRWKNEGEKAEKYAPLALLPVNIKKQKNRSFILERGEEFEVNTTLAEFLKQEFGIDVRGLEGKGLSPDRICAVFRSATANMKDWLVFDDVYIAQFTFVRYAMWADVKNNMAAYRKNPMIAGLISGVSQTDDKTEAIDEDACPPSEIMVPLPCDSAQFAAIAESARGTSFVLHGPPGTGKSQTISNMIANALAGGKRVLFVAEKQAALQVVKKRLSEAGIGDFCLELGSGKTDKQEIVRSLESTLSLSGAESDGGFEAAAGRIEDLRGKLKAPFDALHKKRRLGVSVYEGILYYLRNRTAPDLMDIETSFYDGLTREKLEEYEVTLAEAQAAANECGGVYRSPFAEIKLTECDKKVKKAVSCAAEVVLAELRHLKTYLGLLLETFGQKVSKFTFKKLANSIRIAEMLLGDSLDVFFGCDEREFYAFYNANLRYDNETAHWLKYFKALPDMGKTAAEAERELDEYGDDLRASRLLRQTAKRFSKLLKVPVPLEGKEGAEWIKRACEIEKARSVMLSETALSKNFSGFGGINEKKRAEFLSPLYALHALCADTFMDYNADSFNSVCSECAGGALDPLLSGYVAAAKAFSAGVDKYIAAIGGDRSAFEDADITEIFYEKCTALLDNIDMLPAWCEYRATAKKLNSCGLTFMTDAMERGRISGKQVLASFRKNVYRNFVQTNIPADPDLAAFSAGVADESAAEFSRLIEEFSRLTREKIRADLVAGLPSAQTEGPLALEMMAFRRRIAGNPRALNLRELFREIPGLLKAAAPCMLMSPITVSQYLPPENGLFDLVIFDEASQMPTAEAVPALARAKSAVIVGDPKQLPPTTFFMGAGIDEETEPDEMESVLDDCLALGMPERHLIWHYRSKHESLIAFSNVNYYSSRLCTFPSPDASESKVFLRYFENGVYDRGGTKCNKAEAEALVAEVVRRLKDPASARSSIGIVTFSTPQQIYVEKLLNKALSRYDLEDAAYSRDEPLFVKNLENVQGDERDVILFSVCYGPDAAGRISLNFGPLNQYGGWRRLNVAVSRAREEMIVFSSMRYSAIDLSRTTSRGVAGLRAFLEFAEKGMAGISLRSDGVILNRQSIGSYIAAELENCGYKCRCDVGYSDFKIDVAVLDPADGRNFILAVLSDGSGKFSVKDRTVTQVQTLKRCNWNVIRLYAVNFFNNPKREIKRIKDYLDKLTGGGKPAANAYKKPYRAAKTAIKECEPQYILCGENDAEITRAIKAVVSAEEPISSAFLIKRTLSLFGINRYGVKLESRMHALIDKCGLSSADMAGNVYYFKNAKVLAYDRYRVEEGTCLRSQETDYTPFEVISLVRGMLNNRVSVYLDELIPAALKELGVPRATDRLQNMVARCIDEGVSQGIFIRSVSDKISLA